MTTCSSPVADVVEEPLDHRPRTRSAFTAISAPRKTPVSEAFFCMSGQTSGGAASRPALPTQLMRPR